MGAFVGTYKVGVLRGPPYYRTKGGGGHYFAGAVAAGPPLLTSAIAVRGIEAHQRRLPLSATAPLEGILQSQMFLALVSGISRIATQAS